jgi:hypothetical protein
LNRFNVLPFVCKTDFTHIAIAAFSLPILPRSFPGRNLTVFRTDFIQRQNLLACFIFYLCVIFFPKREQMDINRLTKTRDDLCGIQQYYAQSLGPGKYTTTNLVPDARKVNPLASEQQLMYPREGYGLNIAHINSDSMLRNESSFKSNRCQIRAQARPFLTVPYMAGGRGNPDVESSLLHAEQVKQMKECGTVTETQFVGAFTPLVPSLADNIQNPKNLIPEVAAAGWMRAGIPSRSYMRDINC